ARSRGAGKSPFHVSSRAQLRASGFRVQGQFTGTLLMGVGQQCIPPRSSPPDKKESIMGTARELRSEFRRTTTEDDLRSAPIPGDIVGPSAALRRVLGQAEVVAPTDAVVLIQGETGTGKELVAREVHNLSSRRQRPFIKLNCAAIPSGLVESE